MPKKINLLLVSILVLIITILSIRIYSEYLDDTTERDIIDINHYNLEDNVETVPKSSTLDINIDSLTEEQLFFLSVQRDTLNESFYKPRKTLYYNFHCTASVEGVNLSTQWFKNFFTYERGWSRYGYNWLIELDGSLRPMQGGNWDGYTDYDEVSYGVKGRNLYSINIAYVGGVDKKLKPKNTLTGGQIETIEALIQKIQCSDPGTIIHGHRDNPGVSKACPSFDMKAEFNL